MDNRRNFMKKAGLFTLGLGLSADALANIYGFNSQSVTAVSGDDKEKNLFFKISLAEWSLHRTLQSGKMTNLDFPVVSKRDFGITNVEYVNQFFMDKAKDKTYLSELKKTCDDNGVTSVLIMCDGEGFMGDADAKLRQQAVENHYKWVEAAKFLGCHSIRVNAYGKGTAEEVADRAAESLSKLTEFGDAHEIGIIVENHGSFSSNGKWLSDVMKAVDKKGCGTLPDFGNFCIRWKGDDYGECAEYYDRYLGVEEMMPFAKGVSAKTYDFDDQGNCVETDYRKMLKIVKKAGYKSYIGIEYEGKIDEYEGIRKTLALLKKVGTEV